MNIRIKYNVIEDEFTKDLSLQMRIERYIKNHFYPIIAIANLVPTYLVGGSIRDLIMAKHPKDLDFVVIGNQNESIVLKLLDKFVPEHDNEHSLSHECTEENLMHIGIVSSLAIILHNIIEGMAVYSMTIESVKLGLLVALGVGLHNIPMGMVIYSTLEKEKKNKKIILLSLVVLSTFIGGLLMLLISNLLNEFVMGILICITLGMLLYIIIFELYPHHIRHHTGTCCPGQNHFIYTCTARMQPANGIHRHLHRCTDFFQKFDPSWRYIRFTGGCINMPSCQISGTITCCKTSLIHRMHRATHLFKIFKFSGILRQHMKRQMNTRMI